LGETTRIRGRRQDRFVPLVLATVCSEVGVSKGTEQRTNALPKVPAFEAGLGCAPQKIDPISSRNFFEPVFMVQPAENILRSYPSIGWQLMPMNVWPWPRSTTRIRDSGSQARMWSSMIVQPRYKTPIKLDFEKYSTAGTRGMVSAS
jgi:hypothetical protein